MQITIEIYCKNQLKGNIELGYPGDPDAQTEWNSVRWFLDDLSSQYKIDGERYWAKMSLWTAIKKYGFESSQAIHFEIEEYNDKIKKQILDINRNKNRRALEYREELENERLLLR